MGRDLLELADALGLLRLARLHSLLEVHDRGAQSLEAHAEALGRPLCRGLREHRVDLAAYKAAVAAEHERELAIAPIDDTEGMGFSEQLHRVRRDRPPEVRDVGLAAGDAGDVDSLG